jgi:hypothetical protein
VLVRRMSGFVYFVLSLTVRIPVNDKHGEWWRGVRSLSGGTMFQVGYMSWCFVHNRALQLMGIDYMFQNS